VKRGCLYKKDEPVRAAAGSSSRRMSSSLTFVDNRRLRGYSQTNLPIQRLLTINGLAVPENKITRKGTYKTHLNKMISAEANAAGFSPSQVRHRLVLMAQAGAHVFNTKRDAVRRGIWELQDNAWNALQQRAGIVYRIPALTEVATQTILTNVEQGQPGALAGLSQSGAAYVPETPDDARSHEWGVIKAKSRANECMLIEGDRTSVSFGPFMHFSDGIAHSHPYFTHPRHGGGRTRWGTVSTETKEIADHVGTPGGYAGMVSWNDLINRASPDASAEISKIFPSAPDIKFSAEKNLARHTVYTTYAVLNHATGVKYIINPTLGGGQFNAAPRLNFLIRNARKAADGINFTCQMDALEGTNVIWTRNVTTNGTGMFGLLRW